MSKAKTTAEPWGWEETGPVWGARVFAPKSGQDHLGLGSVSSDRILPALSPGINVLTIHPRYWSFYAWVLDDYWAADLPRNRGSFVTFYRPREAVFSMACHVCVAPEHATIAGNINGSRRISPKVQGSEFDPQFDYIKEPLGGYGLYYRSAMELTGALVVASPANGFPIDAPTPAGRALAAAFRAAVADTEVARALSNVEVTQPISRDALIEFARKACLCQLRVAEDHDLPLLRDLFLHSGSSAEVASRGETLRMLLDLSTCRQSADLTQDDFRQLVYFRQLDGSDYEPRTELVDVARRWRVYQGREYFAYVFNRLLRWISRRGLEATDGGLTLLSKASLWSLVADSLDESARDPDLGLALPDVGSGSPVAELLAHLTTQVDCAPHSDEVWPRHDALDEHALYLACREYDEDNGRTLVALLALVLLLRERFGLPARPLEYVDEQVLLAEGGSLRIGMARFMYQFNQRMLRGPNLGELARWLIEDFVIVQHERVATAKLPDDTYRVRRVGDAVRFFAQEAPAVFNDSRFHALSTTVHELGWVTSFRQPDRRLTASGRDLLVKGDLPEGALAAAAQPFEGQVDAAP
jgi:hypothetical protein